MQSVVHVCTDFWPSTGGIQQFVRDLALRSACAGLRVTVLCFNRVRGFPGRLPETAAIGPVTVHRISFVDLTYYKPVAIPQAVLRSHDLIHVHGVGAPLDYIVLSRWLHRRPIVVSTHGGIFHTSNLSHFKRLYFFGLQRLVLRGVDLIAACSRSDAELFSRIAAPVRVIENAVELQPHLALPADRKQPGRCLYVGRLSQNKGVDLLLRAAASAKRHGARFKLRLVGPDVEGNTPHFSALAARLGMSDCTIFVGKVSEEELLREYELAELFISASQYEGFGLTAIEAKAAGCRLLLHSNDAFCNMFADDPAATLTDFRHSEDAGRRLADLLRQPRDDIPQTTRRDAKRYSWEQRISEWVDLYGAVAGGASSAAAGGHERPRTDAAGKNACL